MVNLSTFLTEKFSELFSANELEHFLEHSKNVRPVTLLVNTQKITPRNLLNLLKRRGIQCEILNPYCLLIKDANDLPIGATSEYLDGLYYIMGISSLYSIISLEEEIKKYHSESFKVEEDESCKNLEDGEIKRKEEKNTKETEKAQDLKESEDLKDSKNVKESEVEKIKPKNKRVKRQSELNFLDMCAAPGGKSVFLNLLIKKYCRNAKFTQFCIDKDEERVKSLGANLIRMNSEECVVIADDAVAACGKDETCAKNDNKKGKKPKSAQGYLPKMNLTLLDAPCSGTGTLSKDPQVSYLDQPTLHSINATQRNLIISAFDNLKGNGLLLYSTCSVLVEENEMVVQSLLDKRKSAKIVNSEGMGHKGFKAYRGKQFSSDMEFARRLYPHTHNGDGFFYCLIRKCN